MRRKMSEIIPHDEIEKAFRYLANLQEDPNYSLFVKRMQELSINLLKDGFSHQLFELGKAMLKHFLNHNIREYADHQESGLVL